MRKGKVLAGIVVILALGAGIAAYVEQRPLLAWFHTMETRVKAIGGQKGEKGSYYCPMHPAFTLDRPGKCSICGMDLVRKETVSAPSGGQTAAGGDRKILYYRNPMDPKITSPVPMKDQMGMDYVPVYEEQAAQTHPGVYISPEKQQLIGVKKDKVQMRKLCGQILTVGRVAYDPALFQAQQEYLQVLKGRQSAQKAGLDEVDDQAISLATAARTKLRLMGMNNDEIDAMEKQGKPETNLYLPSDDDKTVWVYVTIYEYEAGLVKEGMPIQADTLAYPGQVFQGRIVSVTPLLETATRSFKARALVGNPDGKLKLEMFANIRIDYEIGEKLAIPEEAVMHAGTRDIVYVVDSDGYFQPKTVKLGAKAQGWYELLQGLEANEQVVTSANFLVDSESKLNAVLNQMTNPGQQHGDHQ